MTRTVRHKLHLWRGVMFFDVTTTPHEVRTHMSGAEASDAEQGKVRDFLARILAPFNADERPMRMTSAHSPLESVVQIAKGVTTAYSRRIETEAA